MELWVRVGREIQKIVLQCRFFLKINVVFFVFPQEKKIFCRPTDHTLSAMVGLQQTDTFLRMALHVCSDSEGRVFASFFESLDLCMQIITVYDYCISFCFFWLQITHSPTVHRMQITVVERKLHQLCSFILGRAWLILCFMSQEIRNWVRARG